MRIGIFGGSFDPVHGEHIELAKRAVQELRLDKLLIMPAGEPPHKKGKRITSAKERLYLCRAAFEGEEKIEVSDYEITRGGTSYTYQTCEEFARRYQGELFWLVGTDMLRDFPSWRNPERILSCATLAVCGRNEKVGWVEREQARFSRRFGKKFAYLSYEGKDVSSTKLRVLAGAGMRLTGFTPEKVAEYVYEKGLYKIPFADEALQLESPRRREHSIRVAYLAASRAHGLKVPEEKAIAAALFHDCAKNLAADSAYLDGFTPPKKWGEVPPAVYHQFAGAYVAEKHFGVTDRDILNAVRYHTSGRANMSQLEKLIFLADMLEEERSYKEVEMLRALFWKRKNSVKECLRTALYETLRFVEQKGERAYPLTEAAYEFYEKDGGFYGRDYE